VEPYVHDVVVDMQIARDRLNAALDELEPADWSRCIPYGERTLRDLLAHLAVADQAWAIAARGLLRGEGAPEEAPPAQRKRGSRASAPGRERSVDDLRGEMESRRNLLLSLYGLLEKRHLAQRLPAYGQAHNSVRERIWRGHHDRLHTDDIRRALTMTWQPPRLRFAEGVPPVVDALAPDEALYVLYSVDPVYWERPSSVPGWTFRQLLAHIATGDWVFQQHLRSVLERGTMGDPVDVPAGNAERIRERQFSTPRALIDEYLSMRHETVTLLSRLEPRHLRLEVELHWLTPPRRVTFLERLGVFPEHERSHLEQLRPAMQFATSTRG
jgi:hypothetical protein